MISCTDFIPAYSEMFRYLEDNYGRAEIDNYWRTMFKPGGGSPLVNFVEKEGIKGCFTYWKGTLNEEAAHFTMYLNEKRGFFKIVMHRCPSKGRLLALKDSIGITPYPDYCLHCDSYRAAVAEVGLEYVFDFTNTDKAGCSILIYDPKRFDGRVIVDEDTEIMDRRAGDNEYFHPAFHSSLNRGTHYVGEKYGAAVLADYLATYTAHVYAHLHIEERGLNGIEALIRDTYRKEKAEDAVTLTRDGNTLTVTVAYCPGVRFLRSISAEVSPWYKATTEVVMQTLAKAAGLAFTLCSYDEESGACCYKFSK